MNAMIIAAIVADVVRMAPVVVFVGVPQVAVSIDKCAVVELGVVGQDRCKHSECHLVLEFAVPVFLVVVLHVAYPVLLLVGKVSDVVVMVGSVVAVLLAMRSVTVMVIMMVFPSVVLMAIETPPISPAPSSCISPPSHVPRWIPRCPWLVPSPSAPMSPPM